MKRILEDVDLDDIDEAWRRFRIIEIMSRNYAEVPQVGASPHRYDNRFLDIALPGLVLMHCFSLLERAVEKQFQDSKLTFPRDRRSNIQERIDFLAENHLILNASALHDVRILRNALAHKLAFIAWSDLTNAVTLIEDQLLNWKFIKKRAPFHFFAKRSAEKSDKPGVFMEIDVFFGVTCDGKKIFEIKDAFNLMDD